MFVYCDTRWGLQIRLCFTSELGKILGYNGFWAGGIDRPRAQLILWGKVTFHTRLLILHYCNYSAKDVADW